MVEDGTTGFFLLFSCFFLRFSLLRGLLSPMATFSFLVCKLDILINPDLIVRLVNLININIIYL